MRLSLCEAPTHQKEKTARDSYNTGNFAPYSFRLVLRKFYLIWCEDTFFDCDEKLTNMNVYGIYNKIF